MLISREFVKQIAEAGNCLRKKRLLIITNTTKSTNKNPDKIVSRATEDY